MITTLPLRFLSRIVISGTAIISSLIALHSKIEFRRINAKAQDTDIDSINKPHSSNNANRSFPLAITKSSDCCSVDAIQLRFKC